MDNNELIKQAAIELNYAADGDLGIDTIICSSENFYIFLGNVFKKNKAKGNNFGTKICSSRELLHCLQKIKGAEAP